jgi:tetratricopeptide (TPR) repeat protein
VRSYRRRLGEGGSYSRLTPLLWLTAGIFPRLHRVLELAPQNSAVTGSLASLISILRRLDEAVAFGQRALALESLRANSHFNLAFYLITLGRYDEAEAALRKWIELKQPRPTHAFRVTQP